MRERGKAVETHTNFPDFNSSASCKKHPHSSHVGICPHCLKDKLVNLVCSDCGKHRLSSCSCSSKTSPFRRNSCSDIGRTSFSINDEKTDRRGSEKVIFFRRSRSSCVEVERKNRLFWRLFRRKRNTGRVENGGFIGVSSFRGGRSNDFDEGSDIKLSDAKISDVSSGVFVDSCEGNGIGPKRMEIDRVCSIFSIRESDFSGVDDSAFIELKIDSSSYESKQDLSARVHSCVKGNLGIGGDLASLKGTGGSCRISMNERGLKQGGRSYKVWKWIFKYNTSAKVEI